MDKSSNSFQMGSLSSSPLPSSSSNRQRAYPDDENAIIVANTFDMDDKFLNVLDQLDAKVERFRQESLILQEKRDFLLMSIDLIKNHESNFNKEGKVENDEVNCYIKRIGERLSTVDIRVRTIRSASQQESLSKINNLIDKMLTMRDSLDCLRKCNEFLNACCCANFSECNEMDAGPVDKVFESSLLGCTLDDQKSIKKRLLALRAYLTRQTFKK